MEKRPVEIMVHSRRLKLVVLTAEYQEHECNMYVCIRLKHVNEESSLI